MLRNSIQLKASIRKWGADEGGSGHVDSDRRPQNFPATGLAKGLGCRF